MSPSTSETKPLDISVLDSLKSSQVYLEALKKRIPQDLRTQYQQEAEKGSLNRFSMAHSFFQALYDALFDDLFPVEKSFLPQDLLAFVIFLLLENDQGIILSPIPQMLLDGAERAKVLEKTSEEPFGIPVRIILDLVDKRGKDFHEKKEEYLQRLIPYCKSVEKTRTRRIQALLDAQKKEIEDAARKEEAQENYGDISEGALTDEALSDWIREGGLGPLIHHLVVAKHPDLPKGRSTVLVYRTLSDRSEYALNNLDHDKALWIDDPSPEKRFLTNAELSHEEFKKNVLRLRLAVLESRKVWMNLPKQVAGPTDRQNLRDVGIQPPKDGSNLRFVIYTPKKRAKGERRLLVDIASKTFKYSCKKDCWEAVEDK